MGRIVLSTDQRAKIRLARTFQWISVTGTPFPEPPQVPGCPSCDASGEWTYVKAGESSRSYLTPDGTFFEGLIVDDLDGVAPGLGWTHECGAALDEAAHPQVGLELAVNAWGQALPPT
jgi:hypothetical protein